MPAITQIPEHFTTQFDANWKHLVQQMNSRLESYVTLDSFEGKEKSYNQVAPTAMELITSRAGATRISDVALAKRWIRPKGHDTANLFDEWDETLLGQVVLPSSPMVKNHAAAYKRTCDETIIAAALGTAFTGEDGTTPVTLPSPSQEVAVNYVESGIAANSGLTIGKLRQAKYIFDQNEVDEEDERIFVVSAKQLQDLLRTTEITSVDFNSVKALVDGQVDTFMGFKFRRTQLLPLDAATDVRSCFAYAKSGVVLADRGLKTHMDIRVDMSHALQIRSVAFLASTRLEEKKVVAVYCDESP
jgi:hypothetical protein